MIVFSRTLSVNNNVASLNEPIYLFRGDGDITILLDLIKVTQTVKFGKIEISNIITDGLIYATACIYKPSGELAFIAKGEIVDNKVKITLIKDVMDEAIEIGEHKLQIHLFDEEQNRLTIPEVGQIHVREPLCENFHIDPTIVNAIVGESLVGSAVVAEDIDPVALSDMYLSYTWRTGEFITAAKLNNMIMGIDEALSNVSVDLSNYISKEELESKGYATQTFVTNKIAEAQLEGEGIDLSGLATKDELNGYVTKSRGNANQIIFNDGETFQNKLDNGVLKGADGLTTAISVNGQLYTHSNGIITLPDYPTGGGTDTLVVSYEFKVTDPTGLRVNNIFDGALTIEGGKPYTYKLLSNDMQLVTELLFVVGGHHTDDSYVDGEIIVEGLDIPKVYTSPTGIVDFDLWIEGVTGNFTLQIFEGKAQTSGGTNYVYNSGASFVVFGDSYSTYEGWMPETHSIYYPAEDVADVKQTWWWQVANETKMSLMLNDSWSGSTICGTGYEGEDCLYTNSFVNRVATFCDGVRLSNKPNLVFIFGGTNDTWCEAPVGSVKYDDFTTEDLYYVLPAFCSIVNYIQTYIPGCRIINIVNGDMLTADIVNGMAQACEHYGIDNVVLSDISMSNDHPTITGMLQIKNKILDYIKVVNN